MVIRYPILHGRTHDETFVCRAKLGVGGFSLVFEALDNRGIKFGAKIVKSWDAEEWDLTEIAGIKHEGNLLSRLQGNNIVKLIYFHDGTAYDDLPPYLILEFAEDRLSNIIGRRKAFSTHFTVAELLDMFLQISDGMRVINKTVVHCDLNPSNILLIGTTLKISDFGTSETIGQQPNEAVFRKYRQWHYVAPEYWEEAICAREMDIYCAGLVFYEAATLQYPYVVSREGDEESACKYAHTTEVAENPSDLNGHISSKLSSLILKMMAKKPDNRFHSWEEIIAILNQCVVENQWSQ